MRVFADTALNIPLLSQPPCNVELEPPVVLISYWFKESDSDNYRYPAVFRVLAPGDNHILAEWDFAIDFLQSTSSLTVFHISDIMVVDAGLYEFHIEVKEYGEWNIVSRNSLYVNYTVS